MEKARGVIAFDIGGTGVKWAVFNPEDDQIMDRGRFDTNRESGQDVLDQMEGIIREIMKHFELEGIAFSTPGSVETESGTILSGCIIEGFNGLSLKKHFEDLIGLPVVVENDANSATYAEYALGAGRGSKNLAVVTLGTGVGGGIVIDGKLLRGTHSLGGEFGFMFVNGIRDGKPEENIFSNDASTRALEEKAEKAFGRKVNGIELFSLAEQGDATAVKVLNEFYRNLAMGLYNICYTIAPDTVLIGGAISQQPALIDAVKREISALTPSFSVDLTDLIRFDRCQYLNDAGLIGAYALSRSQKKS